MRMRKSAFIRRYKSVFTTKKNNLTNSLNNTPISLYRFAFTESKNKKKSDIEISTKKFGINLFAFLNNIILKFFLLIY